MERATRFAKPYSTRLFFQTVIARAYPRVIGAQREKSWMFFDIFLPLLAVSAYVFVYRAIGAPETYVGFVVMGGAMTAFWMNILWSMSSQLYWEKEQGNLALYIIAPNSLMAILLGMALAFWRQYNITSSFIIASYLSFGLSYTLRAVWERIKIINRPKSREIPKLDELNGFMYQYPEEGLLLLANKKSSRLLTIYNLLRSESPELPKSVLNIGLSHNIPLLFHSFY